MSIDAHSVSDCSEQPAPLLDEPQIAHDVPDLRTIIDSAGDGICTITRDGHFGYVNPRLAQMLSIDASEAQQRHFTEFLHPEDRALIVDRFHERMAGSDVPSEYELELLTQHGTAFWASINVTSLKIAGQIEGSLAVVRDITKARREISSQADHIARLERRFVEQTHEARRTYRVLEEQIEYARDKARQQQVSEVLWRSLVDHAPQFIMLLDNNGLVQFVNRVAPGFDAQDIAGKNLLDLIPNHNRTLTTRILQRVFIEGRRETFEIDMYHSQRAVIWYSVSIGPILDKPDEAPTAAVLIAADITERKAAEAALEKRQKELAYIARLNNMGALTAELAHELNQPLAAISAYANGCLRALNDDRSDLNRVDTALRNICAQSSRAVEIIRKIMDFLRKTDEPRQPTDVNRLIREVVHFLEMESRKYEVIFECELQPDLIHIPVNRVQIEQVLFNLLINAIDAVKGSDPVSRVVRITSRATDAEEVEIRVRDQGCGFEPGDVETLFQPFYSTKGHGLGMGLAISRMIVDEHGGQISATSTPGQGANFTVVLPIGIQSSAEMRAYVP